MRNYLKIKTYYLLIDLVSHKCGLNFHDTHNNEILLEILVY